MVLLADAPPPTAAQVEELFPPVFSCAFLLLSSLHNWLCLFSSLGLAAVCQIASLLGVPAWGRAFPTLHDTLGSSSSREVGEAGLQWGVARSQTPLQPSAPSSLSQQWHLSLLTQAHRDHSNHQRPQLTLGTASVSLCERH